MWVRGLVMSGVINVQPAEGGKVSLEIMGSKSKVSVTEEDGKPAIDINIDLSTRIAEAETLVGTLDESFVHQLIDLSEKDVKAEVNEAVDTCLRKDDSDVFGFGEKIFESKPQLWHEVEANWRQQTLKELPVNVTVKSTIIDVGLINK
jgi:spore germination protein KC